MRFRCTFLLRMLLMQLVAQRRVVRSFTLPSHAYNKYNPRRQITLLRRQQTMAQIHSLLWTLPQKNSHKDPNNQDEFRTFLLTSHQAHQQRPSTQLFMSSSSAIVLEATTSFCNDNLIAWSSMGLLALQFGVAPILQKKFVPKKLCRSTVLMAQEFAKLALNCFCFLLIVPKIQRQYILMGWNMKTWLHLAVVPAFLYAIQNYAKLMAYQHLPAVTYNVLNQTKTLTSAFFCYILLGIKQSPIQMFALLLLLFSALIIENVIKLENMVNLLPSSSSLVRRMANELSWLMSWRTHSFYMMYHQQRQRSLLFSKTPVMPLHVIALSNNYNKLHNNHNMTDTTTTTVASVVATDGTDDGVTQQSQKATVASASIAMVDKQQQLQQQKQKQEQDRDPYHVTRGVLPLMLANLTSGLAAALGQNALQHHHRNIYLYGMELSSVSLLMVLFSLLWTNDGKQLKTEGLQNLQYWNYLILLPISCHAVGGLLVGLVTKYSGAIKKGFSLIFGVLLSGLFQKWMSNDKVTKEQIIGGTLACLSLWMYTSFPPSS